jgi:hypothetical protein
MLIGFVAQLPATLCAGIWMRKAVQVFYTWFSGRGV